MLLMTYLKRSPLLACMCTAFVTACHSPMPPDKPILYSYDGSHHIKDLPSTHIPEVDEDISPHGGPALDVKAVQAKRKEQHGNKPPKQPPLP